MLHNHTHLWIRRRAAFTLLELSVSIAIIAIMMSGALTLMSDFAVKHEAVNAQTDLKEIEEALIAYKDRNGRLPCPASQTVLYGSANYGREVNSGDCTYTVAPAGTTRVETVASSGIWVLSGAVPVRDLLLRDAYLKDGFGDRISYSVPQALANASTFEAGDGVITIKNRAANDIATDAAFALVAHGIDGKGAYREGSGALKVACGASTNLDVENCDGDTIFTDAPYNDGQVTASYFDDAILWKSKVDIIDLDPAAPIGPDFTGFRLEGVTAGDFSGTSVATGDINGDGFDDVIVGADYANSVRGHTYVVFGSATGITTPLDLSTLNGTTGFRLDGATANDRTGYVLSSGDVNNDGYDDVIIGANNSTAGYTYVVFGKAGAWAASTALSGLNGTTGFRLDGPASSYSGYAVSSGDVNNDGYDDVIVGAFGANTAAGYTYVAFGKAGAWASTNALATLANGTTGFRLAGPASSYSGYAVSSGDVNNDGYDDVIVGAHKANSEAGYTYVVFGKAGAWAASTALSGLDGTTGFRLNGTTANDNSGWAVSSGDVNGDGYDDVIVDVYAANSFAGYIYVVFGKAGAWAASTALSSLNGTTGFRLDGPAGGRAGSSVSSGDVNGDGYDDVIVAAMYLNTEAGYNYVVFGKAGAWAATNALATLANGTTGFRLDGVTEYDHSGTAVSSGDVTGDGFADILVGALGADDNSRNSSGSTYGIYGKASGWSATYNLNTITVP